MKAILIIALALTFQGCSTSSLWAGNYEEKEGSGVNRISGQPNKLKKRQSKSAAVAESYEKTIIAIAEREQAQPLSVPETNCYPLSSAQSLELKAEAQQQYFATADRCMTNKMHQQNYVVLGGVIQSLAQGETDIQTAIRVFGTTIVGIEQQSAAKVAAIANPLSRIGIAIEGRKAIESSHDSLTRVGVAAAENAGDITVSGLSTSQTASADSNDGYGGSGGEMGTGGSGTGTGTANPTKTGDTLIIGRNNQYVTNSDDGKIQIDTTNAVQQAPSSNSGFFQGNPVNPQTADDLDVNAAPETITTTDQTGINL